MIGPNGLVGKRTEAVAWVRKLELLELEYPYYQIFDRRQLCRFTHMLRV